MIGSRQTLARRYDVALLDLDGVVYVGEQAVPGAEPALSAARSAGMRLAFVTNNASRTPQQVAELLHKVGVPAEADEVITSAQAAAHYLADRLPACSKVLVLGTTGLIDAVTERGLRPVFSAEDEPVAVVQGFYPGLDWKALAEGCIAIRQGALWLATNLDATVPSPRGPLPGNGSLVAALQHATGVIPAATGKPDPAMHAESVQRSGAKHPIVVGDRLDTDIEGARRADCVSLLVLTGVTTPADLLTASPLHRPDYLSADVSGLLNEHPEPVVADGVIRCGSATVRIFGSELELSGTRPGEGDGLNPLRALAVAGWQLMDAGSTVTAVRAGDDASGSVIGQHALNGARFSGAEPAGASSREPSPGR